MLDFYANGLIVSCGCLWWFGRSNLGVGCECSKAQWIGNKNVEAMLKIAFKGPNENFDNITDHAILL